MVESFKLVGTSIGALAVAHNARRIAAALFTKDKNKKRKSVVEIRLLSAVSFHYYFSVVITMVLKLV